MHHTVRTLKIQLQDGAASPCADRSGPHNRVSVPLKATARPPTMWVASATASPIAISPSPEVESALELRAALRRKPNLRGPATRRGAMPR